MFVHLLTAAEFGSNGGSDDLVEMEVFLQRCVHSFFD